MTVSVGVWATRSHGRAADEDWPTERSERTQNKRTNCDVPDVRVLQLLSKSVVLRHVLCHVASV